MEEKRDLNVYDGNSSPPEVEKLEIVADRLPPDPDDSLSPEERAQIVGWILFNA